MAENLTELTRRTVIVGAAVAAATGGVGRNVAAQTATTTATASRVVNAAAKLPAGGVNLAGADFGKLPGVHGTEYLYPPRAHFDYFRELGFSLIRLPFKWERLQPAINADFAPAELALLKQAVGYATSGGQQLILDPHNYAKRRIPTDGWAKEHGIGSDAVPVAAFADLWSRLATLFKADERVLFGLMNEPVGIKVEPWLAAVNAAIAAIRNTGARNMVLVPGIEYSGAHSWHRLGNTAMAGVRDPLNNFAFDVHQYFDRDSSGTKPDAVSGTIGSERIEAFQTWARQHGFKAYLAEFSGGRNRTAYNALHDLCQEMTANPDVWLGWAAWAAGPRWPEGEMFTLEPWRDGRIREQTAILAHYARPPSPSYWVTDKAAFDLDFARARFHGAPSFDAVLTSDDAATMMRARQPGPTKGMPLAAATAANGQAAQSPPWRLSGALQQLVQGGDAFTLMIEVREVASAPIAADFVVADGRALLRRTQDGALEAGLEGGPRTETQPLRNWHAKRRVALSVDRRGGKIIIGATGAKSVEHAAAVPRFNEVMLGGGAALASGLATRLTAYDTFSTTEQLDALLA